ncbi:MAG: HI0074 family nucleotidyltransferase substrate-binding subunit [Sideroxydans sp.]|nr:HI0074 family nucleotidyltransferase substrate-binding subunit [Sideroxydans sp.]
MTLDYTPLANVIRQLETSLRYAQSEQAKADPGLFEQLRNSVIQCFEFTYELSHKMLRRHLVESSASPEEIETGSFQNLIRSGNEMGLLRSDWTRWRDYRQARNDSSHTYDTQKAEAVYAIAPDFLAEARHLYAQLLARSRP